MTNLDNVDDDDDDVNDDKNNNSVYDYADGDGDMVWCRMRQMEIKTKVDWMFDCLPLNRSALLSFSLTFSVHANPIHDCKVNTCIWMLHPQKCEQKKNAEKYPWNDRGTSI